MTKKSVCKECGTPIIWVSLPNGKFMALNRIPSKLYAVVEMHGKGHSQATAISGSFGHPTHNCGMRAPLEAKVGQEIEVYNYVRKKTLPATVNSLPDKDVDLDTVIGITFKDGNKWVAYWDVTKGRWETTERLLGSDLLTSPQSA